MSKSNPDNYNHLEEQHIDKIISRCTTDENGCMIWTGAKTSHGYGNISFNINGKRRYLVTHRAVYLYNNQKLEDSENLEIDHLCRNRLCCNKNHLEAVTSKTNTLRGISFSAVNSLKTRCKWGHEFNETNTWVSPDGKRRRCKQCDRERRLIRSTIG